MWSLRLWIRLVTNNIRGYIMKRNGLLLVLLSLGISLFAQNVRMPALIDSIHNLSMPIKVLGYGGGNGKTWSGFNKTDRLEDGSVRDRYSNMVRFFTPNNDAVDGMNIEHIWANSWWGHVQNFAYKDLFNLYPSDAIANQRKSNNPIGVVTASDAFDNGVVKVGKGVDPCDGTTQTVWEPADQWKGDFARTYFYMASVYSNFGNLEVPAGKTGDEYKGLELWTTAEGLRTVDPDSRLVMREGVYKLMLEWAKNDPVDQIEISRADEIEWIQGNRNPYVDFPELAEYVWGEKSGQDFDIQQIKDKKNPDVVIEPDPDPSATVKFSVSPLSMVFTALPGHPSNAVKTTVYMQNVVPAGCTAQAEFPYQVSLDGEAWSDEVTTSNATQGFYVRFAGAGTTGVYEGEIVCNAEGADSRVLTVVCNVSEVPFWENFEIGSKSSYAAADVTGNAATWNLSNAMYASDVEKDRPHDGKCVRMKGYVASGGVVMTPAHIMMVSDKENGVGELSFWATSYGTDTGVKIKVTYSLDGGQTWLNVAESISLGSGEMVRYSYNLNQTGKVRIKIENLNVGNKRACIDDIQMTDYSGGTAVRDINAGQDDERSQSWDLSGRRSAGAARGVVIRNGRKVVGR